MVTETRDRSFFIEKFLSRTMSDFMGLFFPSFCLSCKKSIPSGSEFLFCRKCYQKLRLIVEPFCSRCGVPFPHAGGGNHLCGFCLKNKWHFSLARSIAFYEEPLSSALQSFKYAGRKHALKTLSQLNNRETSSSILSGVDVILPVPLHKSRLRQRGFNQSLLLARAFFPQQRKKIFPDILIRTANTPSQTGLSRSSRIRNLKGAFAVVRAQDLKDKKILLVDDVYTTGATVNQCAATLLRSGAAEVSVFTLARVL